jgi:hypothetical protein
MKNTLPELRKGIKYGIFDNGGKTADRYTLAVQEPGSSQVDLYNLSSNATSPDGINQYSNSLTLQDFEELIKSGALGKAVPYYHADSEYPGFTKEVYQAIDKRIFEDYAIYGKTATE